MRRVLLLGGAALIAAALFVVPLPLLVVSPGAALPVGPRVELAEPEDPLDGDFRMTTVRIGDVTAVGAFVAWLDDEREVVSRRQVVPEGVDRREFIEVQERLFDESVRAAAAVGLRAAGFDVRVSGQGVRVVTVVPGAPAEDELRTGDVIIAADGVSVSLASDLVAVLSERSAGDTVTLTVRRGDRQVDVDVELGRLEQLGRAGLGVGIATVGLDIELPFEVEIERGTVVGPSAGLMLALTVFDLASPDNVAGGRSVAGTGTIAVDGTVGPVGGITQKVAAAVEAGAELFLVPAEEAAEARDAAGGDITIVPVETFDDAVEALAGDRA